VGTDDAADPRRGVAEAVWYAGVNGIALPCNKRIRLTVDGQYHFTFQYWCNLFTLMFNFSPVVVPG
jgi:hypothetical protein